MIRSAVVLLGLIIAGCAAAPVPVDRYYRLSVPVPAVAPLAKAPDVRVEPFEVHGIYGERALLSVDGALGVAVQYQHAFWAEPVALMLGDALVASLRAAVGESRVHGRGSRSRPDWVVEPRLRRLEQRIDIGAALAVYAVEFVVEDEAGAPRFVLSLEESAALASTDPADYAAALATLAAAANAKLIERLIREFDS
jgi:ABC-type uncharacterized transport system auxiliary subunit